MLIGKNDWERSNNGTENQRFLNEDYNGMEMSLSSMKRWQKTWYKIIIFYATIWMILYLFFLKKERKLRNLIFDTSWEEISNFTFNVFFVNCILYTKLLIPNTDTCPSIEGATICILHKVLSQGSHWVRPW